MPSADDEIKGARMHLGSWLAVTQQQALRFFVERLQDVTDGDATPRSELLYNASVLAHFATTSTAATDAFPPAPMTLMTVLDVFVLDQSQHSDPDIMEAAGSQCLLLTGFFGDQSRQRHNVRWYASLGAGFYHRASTLGRDDRRSAMMHTMARRFEYWRRRQSALARELRDAGQA